MARIWECCGDEEIAATRARFMADTDPAVQATTIEYLLAAIDGPSRRVLIAGLATAPPAVLETVMAIAAKVLPEADAADLCASL